MNTKSRIGVYGLGVMGRNLALNILENGFSVSGYNRSAEKSSAFLREAESCGFTNALKTESIAEFCQSLARPRCVLLMLKAGDAVDDAIAALTLQLDRGDIIIDAGNSYYIDTARRGAECADHGIYYLGVGVSGGEDGARHGPSIMPGGDFDAFEAVRDILMSISAKVSGEPCCSYLGPGGAGHFVKMVHNGIEYADMQLICEAFHILRTCLNAGYDELADIFDNWNEGKLKSYLIEITAKILRQTDPETGKHMLDVICGSAGQKGTGTLTSISALEHGTAAPTITEAVFARFLSSLQDERTTASKLLESRSPRNFSQVLGKARDEFTAKVHDALFASKICSYAQGFSLISTASERHGWNLDLSAIASLFRGGCIIRAQFLDKIADAVKQNPKNLMISEYFAGALLNSEIGWRETAAAAINQKIPIPAMLSALSYFDAYRSEELPHNLLQAQRDYFGAHTFERRDKPRGEFFSRNWTLPDY